MSARIYSITWAQHGEYDVVFDVDGSMQSMRCRVVEDDEMRIVQAHPDLMTTLGLSPRLIAAAVIAFDRAREQLEHQ